MTAIARIIVIGLVLAGCAGAPPPAERLVVGYVLADAADGTVLAARQPDRAFMPASTAKLATALAAYDVLGPDHRFVTEVRGIGAVVNGVLDGDLVLVGGGDPLLAPGDLMQMVRRLRQAGLRRVTGRFLYDLSALPARPEVTPAQPDDAAYNPGVAALSVDFNRRPAADGGWRPVRRPGRRTAEQFRRLAGFEGLALPPPEPGLAPDGARLLTRHAGLPLAEVLRLGLRYSNNLVAELVGLATARRLLGRPPRSAAESARALASHLAVRLPSWRETPPRLPNHSGLSARARITPRQLADLARLADSLLPLLPAAGSDGAFDGRFDGKGTALRVWAKTGTMAYASGLAGILYADSGRRLVFAVLIGNPPARRAYDARGKTAQPADAAWRRRAKGREGALVRRWIAAY